VYKFLFFLHIVAIVVGIGTVSLVGLYGGEAQRRGGPVGFGILEATHAVTNVAEWIMYTIPVSGILLLLDSHDAWRFDQTWVWLSIVLWAGALALSLFLLRPSFRRTLDLQRQLLATEATIGAVPPSGPPPEIAELERRGRVMALGGTAMNLIMVVIIILMIWKPGV
jgi:hypothetical protein